MPTQSANDFLKDFFSSSFGQHFSITGGFALRYFYHLPHEPSDIDLIANDSNFDFKNLESYLDKLISKTKLQILKKTTTDAFSSGYFQSLEFIFASDDSNIIKVDFINDFTIPLGKIQTSDGLRFDSIENIAVNKIRALTARTDIKDFIDLYYLFQNLSLNLNECISLANQKDPMYSRQQIIFSLVKYKTVDYAGLSQKDPSEVELKNFFFKMLG